MPRGLLMGRLADVGMALRDQASLVDPKRAQKWRPPAGACLESGIEPAPVNARALLSSP